MGLFEGTTGNYYQGTDNTQNTADDTQYGNYQFTSLDDIIDQFAIVYVGENKMIPKANRLDIAFHAQRALAELSFDTFKGKGEATCMIYLQPIAASFQPSSFNKSNSTNDNFSVETLFSSNVFFVCSIEFEFLTVPKTS